MKNAAPHQLLATLVQMFPDFQAQWDEDDNCFRDEDDSYTVHGVFAEFSHYVRAHFEAMSEAKRTELFTFIETCLSDDEAGVVDNAVCTCFLENLTGETISRELRRYLGPKSSKYFSQWGA